MDMPESMASHLLQYNLLLMPNSMAEIGQTFRPFDAPTSFRFNLEEFLPPSPVDDPTHQGKVDVSFHKSGSDISLSIDEDMAKIDIDLKFSIYWVNESVEGRAQPCKVEIYKGFLKGWLEMTSKGATFLNQVKVKAKITKFQIFELDGSLLEDESDAAKGGANLALKYMI